MALLVGHVASGVNITGGNESGTGSALGVAAVVVLRSCHLRAEGKGYAFLPVLTARDVFVHYVGIDGCAFRSLEEGHRVEFEEIQGPRSPQTTSVRAVRAGHAIEAVGRLAWCWHNSHRRTGWLPGPGPGCAPQRGQGRKQHGS
jgi:cold shock protein